MLPRPERVDRRYVLSDKPRAEGIGRNFRDGQGRLEFGQRRGQRISARKSGWFRNMLRRSKQERAVVAQVNLHPGFVLQLMDKLGIHSRTRRSQGLQCRWSLQRAVGQHSGGSVGSFTPRFSALDYQNAQAPFVQSNGE